MPGTRVYFCGSASHVSPVDSFSYLLPGQNSQTGFKGCVWMACFPELCFYSLMGQTLNSTKDGNFRIVTTVLISFHFIGLL